MQPKKPTYGFIIRYADEYHIPSEVYVFYTKRERRIFFNDYMLDKLLTDLIYSEVLKTDENSTTVDLGTDFIQSHFDYDAGHWSIKPQKERTFISEEHLRMIHRHKNQKPDGSLIWTFEFVDHVGSPS